MESLWEIVVPHESYNLIKNPSFERGTRGWMTFGTGGTRERSLEWQRQGWYSLHHEHASGADNWGSLYIFPAADLPLFLSGSYVTLSLWMRHVSGNILVSLYADYSGGENIFSNISYTSQPDGRIVQTIGPLTDTLSHIHVAIYGQSGFGAVDFDIDGIQLELTDYVTTYFDGDTEGCRWLGEYHNSRSYRNHKLSTGGREMNLNFYSTYVELHSGVGMADIVLIRQMQALLDGEILRDYSVSARSIVLSMPMIGSSKEDLHNKRRALLNVLKPDVGAIYRPVILKYTGANKDLYIETYYDGGLSGNSPDGFTENIIETILSRSLLQTSRRLWGKLRDKF